MTESKIITPDKAIWTGNRAQRRAPGAQDRQLLNIINQQTAAIRGMNALLSRIAALVGTPIPEGNEKDADCLKHLLARVEALVALEKDEQPKTA